MQADQEQISKQESRAKRRRKKRIRRIAWRCALSFLTLVALILVAALGAGLVAFRGPSPTIGDQLTMSMLETSALKFVPRIYYSAEEMAAINARNGVADLTEDTDTSRIVIAKPTPTPSPEEIEDDRFVIPEATPVPDNLLAAENGVEIYEIKTGTYSGYMMVVLDPSRVTVGTCRDTFSKSSGLQLKDIAKRHKALAAINGGGFEDPNGAGNGGMPIGLVVRNGTILHGATNGSHNIVVGFTEDNIMVVGKYNGDDVARLHIRDALSFGPALVVNGNPAMVNGASSGLNPRTAIGQRADGAVLLMVIDGRQISSLGATYADCINVMLEFGAINAVNLDGGSSSLMYYNGDYLNNGVVLTGSRNMPTAFIVN